MKKYLAQSEIMDETELFNDREKAVDWLVGAFDFDVDSIGETIGTIYEVSDIEDYVIDIKATKAE